MLPFVPVVPAIRVFPALVPVILSAVICQPTPPAHRIPHPKRSPKGPFPAGRKAAK